jgi:hypothetical protein
MSTRGLIGFVIDGERKFSYNHSDSDYDCLGKDVVNFINEWFVKGGTISDLKKSARKIKLVDPDETPTKSHIEKCKKLNLINLGVSSGTEEDYYCLFRNAQGNFQAYIDAALMPDDHEFFEDSGDCEYAYIIDLDSETLKIYKKCKKFGEFPLKNIPENWEKKSKKKIAV